MADGRVLEANYSYAQSFVVEDEIYTHARARANELGCRAIGASAGAALRMLAVATGARAVVEVGTGAGVAALYLLAGMATDGVLTTIDVEGENQRAAREAFTEAQIAPGRYRLINGSATEVLPRLREHAYDLVLVDADKTAYHVYYEQAVRLLRSGGVLAVVDALAGGRVAETAQRDPETTALRELGRALREDDRFASVLFAGDDGLLVAAKR